MSKKMTKSQNNKMLTGTLAGVAEYFGIDPTIARVIFVFATIVLNGGPILLYILFMLLMPKEAGQQLDRQRAQRPKRETKAQRKRAEDDWNDF
ncbi:PspC domain-containing protein [Enterococcus devriesei]|nr:PspC domain-containing protein [Enterococcus devriesei]